MDNRVVKIFISSTFREMIDERDEIQQIVFVKIRFWARKLGISVVPIDLRWGITEEDITSGKLALQCEEAIKDSAPFFIGVLGNTYGTDTKSVLGYVEKQYYGKSVTDYEITKGVLETNNSKAIIYNLTYSSVKENVFKKNKLRKLKKQIAMRGNLVDINIRERLISTMISDVEDLLKSTFPYIHGDDVLSRDKFNVESCFYSQYYNTFFSREYFSKYLDVDNLDDKFYLVKAAEYETIHFFLYNMANLLKNNEMSIIYHDCRVSSYGKKCDEIIKHFLERIYRDLNRYYYSCGDIYEDFLTIVDQIDPKTRYVLFIDSLKNIDSKEADKLVEFLLTIKKFNISIFCSDFSNGELLFKMNNGIEIINIVPLSKNEASHFIYNFLHEYKKDNSARLTDEIILHLLNVNNYEISVIQLIINEVLLRGCPSGEIIHEIDNLTNETDMLGVIRKIINRILNNVSKNCKLCETIKVVSICLSLTDEYLTKLDLENIALNLIDNSAYVVDALELLNELITVDTERYSFRSNLMQKAVKQMFADEISDMDLNGIYEYFSHTPISLHSIKEIIGSMKRQKNQYAIIDYLLTDNVFEKLYVEDMSRMYKELSFDNSYALSKIKHIIIQKTTINNLLRTELLVDYVINCCKYEVVKEIIDFLIQEDSIHASKWSIRLGYLEREKGNYKEAINVLRKALDKYELSKDEKVKVYDYVSYCYGKVNMLTDAIKFANFAIELRRENLTKFEFDLPVSLNSAAYSYYRNNSYEKALTLYQEASRIRIKYLGAEHPRVSNNMNNIGKVYLREKFYREAYDIFLRSYDSLNRILGGTHIYTLICRMNCILCELLLNIKDPSILLGDIEVIKKSLESQMKYNDYLAYADFVTGCLFLADGDVNNALVSLRASRAYYLKTFGNESFEISTIDTIINKKSVYEEAIF